MRVMYPILAVVLPSLKKGCSSARSENLTLGQIPSSIEIVTVFLSLVFGSKIYFKWNNHVCSCTI